MSKFTVVLPRERECKGSVRFLTKAKVNGVESFVDNIYISRKMPGINEAQEVTVTVEVGKVASDAELLAKLA